MSRAVLFFLVLVICEYVTSDSDCCEGCQRSYVRVKRGKYYSGPPQRFYSRPPPSFPIKGPYSYTPPPFMANNGPNYPTIRPYKVSKRPTNEGLGDEDINNLVKYLTKKDLDKILEFAYDKEKNYDDLYTKPPHRGYEKPLIEDIDTKSSYQDPHEPNPNDVEFSKYVNYVAELTPVRQTLQDIHEIPNNHKDSTESLYKIQSYLNSNVPESTRGQNYVQKYEPNSSSFLSDTMHERRPEGQTYVRDSGHNSIASDQEYLNAQSFINPSQDVQESTHYGQRYVNNEQENYVSPGTQSANQVSGPGNPYFSESNEEEKLPRPVNMRDEDIEVSFTNNVPRVVKADSASYKVEDFGNLPLMNFYDSKLHSVSSYHVPHYTVTTPTKRLPAPSSYTSSLVPSPGAASIKAPPLEPAPPASAAQEQSDAHLKAIKIWMHRSKGTAYTLHNDGSLTLEKPGRPKYG